MAFKILLKFQAILLLSFFCGSLSFGQRPRIAIDSIELYVNLTDRMRVNQQLEKIILPDMHLCGGAVTGYFKDTNLVYIESTYQAELGYTSKTVYFHQNQVIYIEYMDRSAEWSKYEKAYPPSEFDFDESKMTYKDKIIYVTCLGNTFLLDCYDNGIQITVDPIIEFFEKLKLCGIQMKVDLMNERSKL